MARKKIFKWELVYLLEIWDFEWHEKSTGEGEAFEGKENQLKLRIIKFTKLKFQLNLETLQKYAALRATALLYRNSAVWASL